MKTKIITAGAVTASLMAFAATTSHATTLLSYSAVGNGTNLIWTETPKKVNGKPTTFNGALSTPANDVVSVTMPGLTGAITAYLTLTGTSVDAANTAATPLIQQPIDTGMFTFTAINAFTFNGESNKAGTVLLSGAFKDATILGTLGSSLGNIGVDIANVTSISTQIKGLELGPAATDTFDLSLTSIAPKLALNTGALASFKGVSTGSFTGAVVPEPATWAMMLVGFGGLGVAVRSRRKPAIATA